MPTFTTQNEFRTPVEFAGVTIGDENARIGIAIDRADISLERADTLLCGRRLTVTIMTAADGEDQEQMHLLDTGDRYTIEACCDSKRFGVSPDTINAGLVFYLADIDTAELCNFARKRGLLCVTGVDDLEGASEPDAALSDDVHAIASSEQNTEGELPVEIRELDITAIGLRPGDAEKIGRAGLHSVGRLQDHMQRTGTFWFTEVAGVGRTAADRIENAFNAFVMRNLSTP